MDEFEKAKDKIMMGAERRSMVMSDEEKRMTAYHEAGHAIVGVTVPEHDPVYKVTIIPRGRALGVTHVPARGGSLQLQQAAARERRSPACSAAASPRSWSSAPTRVTTGASNDIERATDLARNMVTKWGLSDRLGPADLRGGDGEVFLGRSVTQHKQVSDVTAHAIDEEVRRVIDDQLQARARASSRRNLDKLHAMAEALIKYETIDEEQIKDIMAGRAPQPPEGWDDSRRRSGGKPARRRCRRRPAEPARSATPAGQH